VYRLCIASFEARLWKKADLAILETNHKDDFEPYWQDEKDWLCIVEFLPCAAEMWARLWSKHNAP
jgi:hypothetical protein